MLRATTGASQEAQESQADKKLAISGFMWLWLLQLCLGPLAVKGGGGSLVEILYISCNYIYMHSNQCSDPYYSPVLNRLPYYGGFLLLYDLTINIWSYYFYILTFLTIWIAAPILLKLR